MPNPTEPKRGRGRPPGPKKEPKPPAKMGRPSPWSAKTEVDINLCVPRHVEQALRYFEFKKIIDAQAVEFLKTKK